MKYRYIIIIITLMIFFTSCTSKNYLIKITEMKSSIPDLCEFVENHSLSLDIILKTQSEVNKQYFIMDGYIKIMGENELKNKVISETRIDKCDFFDETTIIAINQILEACPEYTHINISPNAVMILYKQNEYKTTVLFLSSYYFDNLSEESGGYCEKINDVWNAVIYYYFRG